MPQVGLVKDQHFVASETVSDLPDVLRAAVDSNDSALIALRGSEYAHAALDPAFVRRYWHDLFTGYASLFDWNAAANAGTANACAWPHRQSAREQEGRCMRGLSGGCKFRLLDVAPSPWLKPIPSLPDLTARCSTSAGLRQLHKDLAYLLPARFVGASRASNQSRAKLLEWMQGVEDIRYGICKACGGGEGTRKKKTNKKRTAIGEALGSAQPKFN